MTRRKKRLILLQIFLLLVGSLVVIYTISKKDRYSQNEIITDEAQKKVKEQIDNQQTADVFFNIEYSGLDLSGNRYILKSKEATTDKLNPEIVSMKFVEATFYFKDNTILNVWSDSGQYNNKTLDMNFDGNVKALYENSELYAKRAEYSNSESFLKIYDKVKVKDKRGTIFADKLLFDIKKKKLNIASFNDGKINAKIDLK